MDLYTSILYLGTAIGLITIGTLSFLRDPRSIAHESLFWFAIAAIGWMLSLYLGYVLADPNAPSVSTAWIRLTFTFGVLGTFFLCIFIYFYPKKTVLFPRWFELIFLALTLFVAIFSSFTDLVYKSEILVDGQLVADVLGPFHWVFLSHHFFHLFFATWLCIRKITISEGLERKKMWFVLVAVLSMVLPGLIFHTILPIFDIYLLQQEVVLFYLVFVGVSFYSMLKHRFLDVRLVISKTTKHIVAFLISLVAIYFPALKLWEILGDEWFFILHLLAFLIGIFIYLKIIRFLNSDIFYRFFGMTSGEYFQKTLRRLRNSQHLYGSFQKMKGTFENFFCENLEISSARIFILSPRLKLNYPELVRYCSKNEEILLLQEMKFTSEREGGYVDPIQKELEMLGDICIPLFRNEKKSVGFFILGKKKFGDLYSLQEIKSLQKIQPYLGLHISGALYNRDLHEEVDHKTKILHEKNIELSESNRKLAELDRLKDDFLSIASHELRTPMAVIRGYADFLLAGDFGKLNEKQSKPVEKIFQSTTNLLSLVNKMLDLGRLEAGKLAFEFENFYIRDVLKDMMDEFQILCDRKKIDFKLTCLEKKSFSVCTDKQRFQEIMSNLLGNAIKFTPEGGRIQVIFSRYEKDPKFLQVSVCDTGEGISKEDQENIFMKFHQAKDFLKKYREGTGLGLSIVKEFLKGLDGDIWVESELGKGACFTFILPIEHESK